MFKNKRRLTSNDFTALLHNTHLHQHFIEPTLGSNVLDLVLSNLRESSQSPSE